MLWFICEWCIFKFEYLCLYAHNNFRSFIKASFLTVLLSQMRAWRNQASTITQSDGEFANCCNFDCNFPSLFKGKVCRKTGLKGNFELLIGDNKSVESTKPQNRFEGFPSESRVIVSRTNSCSSTNRKLLILGKTKNEKLWATRFE